MVRPNDKARKIAYSILGKPVNFEKNDTRVNDTSVNDGSKKKKRPKEPVVKTNAFYLM